MSTSSKIIAHIPQCPVFYNSALTIFIFYSQGHFSISTNIYLIRPLDWYVGYNYCRYDNKRQQKNVKH